VKYTVIGTAKNGDKVTVTWEDGKLTGDYVTVRRAESLAKMLEGERVGPVCGPYTESDHLSDPISTLVILREIIDITDITGNVPQRPPIPDGAIG